MDKEELRGKVVGKMMEYRGLLNKRYTAANYVDIDRAGPALADEIIDLVLGSGQREKEILEGNRPMAYGDGT